MLPWQVAAQRRADDAIRQDDLDLCKQAREAAKAFEAKIRELYGKARTYEATEALDGLADGLTDLLGDTVEAAKMELEVMR